jgi:cardiolipin synthase
MNWIALHILSTLGFILALLLFSNLLKQRKSPASILAWLMAIVFVPYVGVPLYLMLGGRKMARMTEDKKPPSPANMQLDSNAPDGVGSAPSLEPGRFPTVSGNRMTILSTGETAFQETMRLIDAAEQTIFIATFILGKDATGKAIMEKLARKARQGVNVRLLLDALGSVHISHRFLTPLTAAGGKCAFFMPMIHWPFRGRANLRNHRKMLIVDQKAAIIGGMNLAAEYMGSEASPERWTDLSIQLEGPVVAHLTEIFRSDWRFAAKEDLSESAVFDGPANDPPQAQLQLIASGPDVPGDTLRDAVLTALFNANRRVWVVTPYFVPDELLLGGLCIAARRGIDVRLIIPRRSNHRLADLSRESYLNQLQEAGAKIRLYRPRMLHAKAVLIDDALAVIGSANMDMRSLLLNFEVGLCIYDKSVITQIDEWMKQLMAACSMRTNPRKSSLSLMEGVGRILAPLL